MTISVPTYSVYTRGSKVWKFKCESCSEDYFYRQASEGKSQDYVGVGRWANKDKADAEAQRKLDDALAKLDQVVPCPSCGQIQSSMLELARQKHLEWLTCVFVFPIVMGISGLFVALILFIPGLSEAFFMANYRHMIWASWFAIASIISIACGFLLLKFKDWISSGYDPNSRNKEKRIALGRTIAGINIDDACSIRPKYPLKRVAVLLLTGMLTISIAIMRWDDDPIWLILILNLVFAFSILAAISLDSNYRIKME